MSETILVKGLSENDLNPWQSEHRHAVVKAFCKRHRILSDLEYGYALFDMVMGTPLVGDMIFAHTVQSAVKVLESAAIERHRLHVWQGRRKPALSGSRVGNSNEGPNGARKVEGVSTSTDWVRVEGVNAVHRT